jgi:hypothetical protein
LVGSADFNGLRLGFNEPAFEEATGKILWSHTYTYAPEGSHLNPRLTAHHIGAWLERRELSGVQALSTDKATDGSDFRYRTQHSRIERLQFSWWCNDQIISTSADLFMLP